MASQSEAVRFSHLLEPIRDLAQNWSIDIASELEEYLTELEEITISFDDGVELDFAEAALVIQGSAVIYSKKVEHLYTLVYNMINQVVEKKRAAEEAAQRRRSRGDTADADEEEEEGDFTALDDTLKEVGNISLPATAATTGTSRSITLASAPVGMLPQPGGGGGGEGGNMQGSRLHPSGALLLPHLVLPTHVLAALPSPSLTLGSAPSLDLPAPPPPPDAAEGGAGDDDDDDGDMGMPDMGDGDEGWTAALGASPPSFDGGGGGAEPASPTPMSVARTPLSGVGNKKVEAPAAAVWDPWAPLDPHDSSGAARRPFRKGATYSAPPPLDGPGAAAGAAPPEKESACAAGVAEGPWGGGVLAKVGLAPSPTATAVPAAASPTSIMSAMRAPLWEQFEEMHAAEAQRRAAARKKHRLVAAQRAHVPSADADAAEIEAGDIVREADVPAAAAAEVAAEVDYEDGPIGFDNDDDGGFGGVFEAAEMGEAADASADGSQLGGSTAPFAGFGSEGGGAAGAEAGSSTYEDLCRAHVESCLEASSSYQEDFELHRRVAEWSKKVEPVLRDEACRADFDIVAYGTRLLDHFEQSEQATPRGKAAKRDVGDDLGSSSATRPFAALAQTTEQYEVCRMFLATLQLVNAGNVELVAGGDIESGDMTLDVSLLSRERTSLAALAAAEDD